MSLSSNNVFTILTLSLMIQQVVVAAEISDDCAVVNSLRGHFGIDAPKNTVPEYGCCDRQEILCDEKKVIAIYWSGKEKNLRKAAGKAIPDGIGNLTNLQVLYALCVYHRDMAGLGLIGEIPETFSSLTKLRYLDLSKNGLVGTFEYYPWITTVLIAGNQELMGIISTQVRIKDELLDIDVADTQVAIGGPMADHAPLNVLPNLASVQQLLRLATIPPETGGKNDKSNKKALKKRLIAATFATDYGTFTCSTNSTTGSPYQDCINTIAAFCQEKSPLFSGWSNCHGKVLAVRNVLNANWKNYINSCAKFAGGSPTSVACSDSTNRIITQEVYYYYSGGILRTAYIPEPLPRSAAYIWYT